MVEQSRQKPYCSLTKTWLTDFFIDTKANASNIFSIRESLTIGWSFLTFNELLDFESGKTHSV